MSLKPSLTNFSNNIPYDCLPLSNLLSAITPKSKYLLNYNPKYLKQSTISSCYPLNIHGIKLLSFLFLLLIYMHLLFCVETVKPFSSQNLPTVVSNYSRPVTLWLINTISSAKSKRCNIIPAIFIPAYYSASYPLYSCSTKFANLSTYKLNNVGEALHPYLTPKGILNRSIMLPSMHT